MDTGTGGIDPRTIQAIRECLERQFVNVKFSQTVRPTFGFRHGVEKQSWHVVFHEQLLTAPTSGEELQRFVEHKVMPMVLKNPGKRIQISKYRDITVEEKHPS
jgi:hypothetical protein